MNLSNKLRAAVFVHCAISAGIFCSISLTAFAEDASSIQTGSFTIEGTPSAILGEDGAGNFTSVLPADKTIEWEITVPENYDPAEPPGLLVYISPSDSGHIPRGWGQLTSGLNLIWVGANSSGNQVQVARRITYALLAIGLVGDRYEIDENRVYLTGFSGGARVSGIVAATYPDLFKGAIYLGGAEIWGDQESPRNLASMQENRYAFIVGADDRNRRVALAVQSRYEDVGITNTKMNIIRRFGHALPKANHMIDALNYLDGTGD